MGAITGFVPGAAVVEQIGTTVGLENEWLEPRPVDGGRGNAAREE